MANTTSTTTVRPNPERSRYELFVGNEIAGIADYVREGDTFVIPHTVIERARRNRGLGAVLVAGALDDIRRAGDKVVPQCWYVAEFIEQNDEYADLLADS